MAGNRGYHYNPSGLGWFKNPKYIPIIVNQHLSVALIKGAGGVFIKISSKSTFYFISCF